VRRLLSLSLLLFAVSACGATAAVRVPLVFGVTGGNMVPYRVTIRPNGTVRVSGSFHARRRHLAASSVRRLRRDVRQAHLESRQCPGVLPDIGLRFIRAGSRTWTVHGDCEQRFERVWNELAHAVGLGPGLSRT
jgi:hypothetical protein